jgi:hypothetical protein
MRAKKIFSIYFEKRLDHWARWVININHGWVGYPSESSITSFHKNELDHNRIKTSSIPFYDPLAEEVNVGINKMRTVNPLYTDAVYSCYTTRKPPKELAEERGISARTFRERLFNAKCWLEKNLNYSL